MEEEERDQNGSQNHCLAAHLHIYVYCVNTHAQLTQSEQVTQDVVIAVNQWASVWASIWVTLWANNKATMC